MDQNQLSVRPWQRTDIPLIVRYWMDANEEHLRKMGVDPIKRHREPQFSRNLYHQFDLPKEEQSYFYVIWEHLGQPIGHSNLYPIEYGKQAFMHLHVWKPDLRQKGMGTELVRKSIPFYFEQFRLEILYCEPYALNSAPNRTLQKAGFTFVKEYLAPAGLITHEQPMKQWKITRAAFKQPRNNPSHNE